MAEHRPGMSVMASLASAAMPIKVYSTPAFLRDGLRVLKCIPDLAAVYVRRRLEPAFRERLWVAISAANVCRYGSYMHQEWARRVGVSEADIRRLEGLEATDLERRLRIASDYVVAFVRKESAPVPERIRVLFESEFSPDARRCIESLAGMANFANLTGNTFDALLARLRQEPMPGSALSDELLVSLSFFVFTLFVAPVLTLARRQTPAALLRDFAHFSRRFHERVPI